MSPRKAVLVWAVAALAGSSSGADELLGLDTGGFLFAPDFGASRMAAPPVATTAGVSPVARPAATAKPVPTVRLAWLDPAHVVGLGAAGARDEASRVFRTMGIATSWRRAEAREAARAGEVRVVLLGRGAVDARHAIVLGATPSHFEQDAPLVWVHVPGVRAVLGLAERGPATFDLPDAYRLGLALGRVIAHELVHALAPGLPHGEGLMASRLTRAQLTAASMPVSPDVGPALRSALAGGPVAPRPDTSQLTVEHTRERGR